MLVRRWNVRFSINLVRDHTVAIGIVSSLISALPVVDNFDVLHAAPILMRIWLAILDVPGLSASMYSGRSTAGVQPLVNNLLVDLIKIIMISTLRSI